jgi:transposase
MYKCDKCKLEINRDINGARNIYIKTIAKLLC